MAGFEAEIGASFFASFWGPGKSNLILMKASKAEQGTADDPIMGYMVIGIKEKKMKMTIMGYTEGLLYWAI